MTFKVSDNQYGRPQPSDSWASCLVSNLRDSMFDGPPPSCETGRCIEHRVPDG